MRDELASGGSADPSPVAHPEGRTTSRTQASRSPTSRRASTIEGPNTIGWSRTTVCPGLLRANPEETVGNAAATLSGAPEGTPGEQRGRDRPKRPVSCPLPEGWGREMPSSSAVLCAITLPNSRSWAEEPPLRHANAPAYGLASREAAPPAPNLPRKLRIGAPDTRAHAVQPNVTHRFRRASEHRSCAVCCATGSRVQASGSEKPSARPLVRTAPRSDEAVHRRPPEEPLGSAESPQRTSWRNRSRAAPPEGGAERARFATRKRPP
jgi:hypothetical protein